MDSAHAYAPTAPAADSAPLPSARLAPTLDATLAKARAKLWARAAVFVGGEHLYLNGRRAHGGNLGQMDGLSLADIVANRHALGLVIVDRVIDRPVMVSTGRIVERGLVADVVRGHVERALVFDVGADYPRVPPHAPPMPRWNEDVFEDRDSALVFAACLHAVAAPRAITDIGIVAVTARNEKVARALVDLMSVIATGAEAPRSIVLGDVARDFLSGFANATSDDDDDATERCRDDESDEVLGPDPILGLCVVRDTKELVHANPEVPIITLNVPTIDLDSFGPIRHIHLKRNLFLDHEEVELAHASHPRLYVECLARVRDAGAPITFDRLLQYLRRISPPDRVR